LRAAGLAIIGCLSACAFSAEYFPPASLGDTPREHQFQSDWYSKHLSALHEPSLWLESLQNPAAEVYRFLWLRSFHHPIVVRLVVSGETGLLTAKEANGQGGYQPGRLIRDTTVRLSKQQTQWFRDWFENIGFWKLPSRQEAEKDVLTLDGAAWVAEAVKGGRYKIVDRTSPPAEDPIHWIGTTLMIDLAHFRLLYQEVY